MTKYEQILSHLPKSFDEPIEVSTPNPIAIQRIEKGNGNSIYLCVWRDSLYRQATEGAWYQLEETDKNYDLVADSILKRLDTIQP
jgi:hypothetical protein